MTATTSVGGPARTLTANQARQQATRCELDQIEAALRALRRQRVPIAYPPSPATPGIPDPPL